MTRVMLSSVLVLVFTIAAAGEEELVAEIPWSQRDGQADPNRGEVQADGTLLVEGSAADPESVGLAALESPGITKPVYAIRGEVRYSDVSPGTHLEMWSYFPDGGHYYSRTLAGGGLMQSLEGTSSWREFALPFYAKPGDPPPTKLELNLVLSGPGRVELRPLRLVEYDAGEDPVRATGAWWGDRTGGMIGGVLGAVMGCFGALIGTLAGTGRGRSVVLVLLPATGCLGVVLFGMGTVALALGQPYGVFYPLVLTGLIAGILGFALLPGVRRRYEQIELRRMVAIDA